MPVSKLVLPQWAGSVIQPKTSPIIRGPRGVVGEGAQREEPATSWGGGHAVFTARRQGVSIRLTTCTTPSRTSASSTQSTIPSTIGG